MRVEYEILVKFQSTLPRGERLAVSVLMLELSRFNPRSHAGSDG